MNEIVEPVEIRLVWTKLAGIVHDMRRSDCREVYAALQCRSIEQGTSLLSIVDDKGVLTHVVEYTSDGKTRLI